MVLTKVAACEGATGDRGVELAVWEQDPGGTKSLGILHKRPPKPHIRNSNPGNSFFGLQSCIVVKMGGGEFPLWLSGNKSD